MFTDSQLSEIRNYLLSKKLPIDILIEVNDHFVSQINDLQREENLSFEEAFEKTKISWKEELKMVMDNNDYTRLITPLYKKMYRRNLIDNIKATLHYSLPVLVIFYLSGYFLPSIMFKIFTIILVCLMVLLPSANYFMNREDLYIPEKYKKYKLSFNYTQGGQSFGIIYFALMFIKSFSKNILSIQNLFHFKKVNLELEDVVYLILGGFILFFISIYFYIVQNKYLKYSQKIKVFLKKIEP